MSRETVAPTRGGRPSQRQGEKSTTKEVEPLSLPVYLDMDASLLQDHVCTSLKDTFSHFKLKHVIKCHHTDNADDKTNGIDEVQVNKVVFAPTQKPRSSCVSPDVIATCGGSAVVFTDVKKGCCVAKLRVTADDEELLSLAWAWLPNGIFNPGDYLVATGGASQTVYLIDTLHPKCLYRLTYHGGKVTSVAFSPGHKRRLYASTDGTIRVWNIPNNLSQPPTCIAEFGRNGMAINVLLPLSSVIFAVGHANGTVAEYQVPENDSVYLCSGKPLGMPMKEKVTCLMHVNVMELLRKNPNEDVSALLVVRKAVKMVTLISRFDGRVIAELELPKNHAYAEAGFVVESVDGPVAVFGTTDGALVLYDLDELRESYTLRHSKILRHPQCSEKITDVAVSWEGHYLVAVNTQNRILVWELMHETTSETD